MMGELVIGVVAVAGLLLVAGCSTFKQSPDEVLIREPGHRRYTRPAAQVKDTPAELRDCAVLSSNIYNDEWKMRMRMIPQDSVVEVVEPDKIIELDGWSIWADFPGKELRRAASKKSLYFEVWQSSAEPPTIAVVFKGTAEWKDWISNFGPFLKRLIPGLKDQYTVLSTQLGAAFIEELEKRGLTNKQIRVVSTGHSLGGGLAQHFAYSLPVSTGVPRVAQVYAFDPSPVTGWTTVKRKLRKNNTRGLQISRAFEHGEILAYIRLVASYILAPSRVNPAIREMRYNFITSGNIIASHSMFLLADNLVKATGKPSVTPDTTEKSSAE